MISVCSLQELLQPNMYQEPHASHSFSEAWTSFSTTAHTVTSDLTSDTGGPLLCLLRCLLNWFSYCYFPCPISGKVVCKGNLRGSLYLIIRGHHFWVLVGDWTLLLSESCGITKKMWKQGSVPVMLLHFSLTHTWVFGGSGISEVKIMLEFWLSDFQTIVFEESHVRICFLL